MVSGKEVKLNLVETNYKKTQLWGKNIKKPTDEVLSQLMREAAQDAQKANEQATQRYFEELRQAAAAI